MRPPAIFYACKCHFSKGVQMNPLLNTPEKIWLNCIKFSVPTNPCKCGYYPDRNKCSCTPAQVRAYFGKLSRPLLDRIDVCVQVPRIKYEDMVYDGKDLYTNEYMRSTVERVFNIQKERFAHEKYSLNSSIPAADVSRYCILDREAGNLMNSIYDSCDLSARGYHKLLKVARTIADIDGSEHIMAEHICEASGYRMV